MVKFALGFALFVIIIVVAAAVVYFAFMREPAAEEGLMSESSTSDSDDTMAPLIVGNNVIYVSDAKPLARIRVGLAILAGGGYVVIHEDSEGKPGAIVGNSDILPQGESRGFEITLSRESLDGETFYAMLHSDNGDGVFNPAEDAPIKDDQGNIVLMIFHISSSAEEPDAFSL